MPTCDPEKFVNREKELSLIRDKVSRLAKGESFAPDERVVHFAGPSRIGKSCLLEKTYEILSNESACVPILIKLETLNRKPETFVEEFLARVYQEFCIYQNLEVNTILKKTSGSLKLHSSMVVRAINLSTVAKVAVLLLDEIDILRDEELLDIEVLLLDKLIQGNKRAILITAGRSYPMFQELSLRPGTTNSFVLSSFDEKTTSKQLEALWSGSATLARKIMELGSGVPGNNSQLLEHAVGNPPYLPDELQAVQSLLASLKAEIEKRFHPIIEAICVLQSFFPEDIIPLLKSHQALGGEWDEAKIKQIFLELKQIQIGPGGLINWDREKKSWVMDEPTRTLFERELKMRDPELWRQLHCRAYQMYQQWGEEFNSELYRRKAESHRECLQAAEMNCD